MKNSHASFWDKCAQRYAKSPIADEQTYQKKLSITQKYFTPQSEVLEFACGTGSTAIIHAPLVKSYLATDISQNMLDIAQEKTKKAGISNLSFEHTDMNAFDPKGKQFDVILCMSILHLIEDKETAMKKIFTLLKPGGIFVSSTICMGDVFVFNLIRLISPPLKLLGLFPSVVKFFKAEQLKQSVQNAGFTIEYEMRPKPSQALFLVCKKNSN